MGTTAEFSLEDVERIKGDSRRHICEWEECQETVKDIAPSWKRLMVRFMMPRVRCTHSTLRPEALRAAWRSATSAGWVWPRNIDRTAKGELD